MKNFLTKKATMIGSIVAAAVVFVLLVVFCARPVSLGYTYSRTDKLFDDKDVTVQYHFNSGKKVTVSVLDENGKEYSKEALESIGISTGTFYYVEKDGYVCIYDAAEAKDVKDADFRSFKLDVRAYDEDELEAAADFEINAFRILYSEIKCGGAVATVVVLAVVDLLLAGFAEASILLSKKN